MYSERSRRIGVFRIQISPCLSLCLGKVIYYFNLIWEDKHFCPFNAKSFLQCYFLLRNFSFILFGAKVFSVWSAVAKPNYPLSVKNFYPFCCLSSVGIRPSISIPFNLIFKVYSAANNRGKARNTAVFLIGFIREEEGRGMYEQGVFRNKKTLSIFVDEQGLS